MKADIIRLAGEYGRYGYRQITVLLRWRGWQVNHKRVERIWRQEYNTVRPHSSLRYRPPAPETIQPLPIPQIIPLFTPPQMEAENNGTLT